MSGTASPKIAIVDIPGKGKGVIANEPIFRGTLIISEKPRIVLPAHAPESRIHAALSKLSREDTMFLLSFPCGPNDHPILGRLKHFTPCVGDAAIGRGLCPMICRVNHTCYSPLGAPNAAYFWNVDSQSEELWAIKDIHNGQELEVSYMEDVENYQNPRAHLRRRFAFECSCRGCTRPVPEQAKSEGRILAYNAFVRDLPSRFGRDAPLQILKDIENNILIICEEGYTGEIRGRAHDAFQLCAYYGDADSAKKWEEICRDYHLLYQGRTKQFEQAQNLAAKPQGFRAWQQLGRRKLRGPSKEVLEYSYPKSPMVLNEAPSTVLGTSTNVTQEAMVPSTSTAAKPSKGQKKKAKARAKKLADVNKTTAQDAGDSE
ncbi:hypothetical protein C8R46DRAFT_980885 [Mycena filopes]|nr:hypothetical protein C8R46DRAFT_980885 [Mycena filopes]